MINDNLIMTTSEIKHARFTSFKKTDVSIVTVYLVDVSRRTIYYYSN